jgi:hypothetical protein
LSPIRYTVVIGAVFKRYLGGGLGLHNVTIDENMTRTSLCRREELCVGTRAGSVVTT